MSQEKLNGCKIVMLKSFRSSLMRDIAWRWFIDEKFVIDELAQRIENMIINGTSDGKPYDEPVKVITDEDARQRPWVMVRDYEDTKWYLRKLLAVVERHGFGKYSCLYEDGKGISNWHQCRFPTDEERRKHGI